MLKVNAGTLRKLSTLLGKYTGEIGRVRPLYLCGIEAGDESSLLVRTMLGGLTPQDAEASVLLEGDGEDREEPVIWEACVSARELSKAMAKGPASLEPTPDGGITVTSGGCTSTVANAIPLEDLPVYPGLPDEIRSVACIRRSALDTLKWVLDAVSMDEFRPAIECLYLEAEKEAKPAAFVSTDGHRLHHAPAGEDVSIGVDCLLPGGMGRLAVALQAILPGDDWQIHLQDAEGGTPLRIDAGSWEVVGVEPDLPYPDHSRAVPRAFPVEVGANRRELQRLAKQLLKGASVGGAGRITFNGAIDLRVNAEAGPIEASMPHLGHSGGDLDVGLNLAYLAAALEGTGKEVVIRGSDELGPVQIEHGDGKWAIVMPMRL